MFEKELNLNQVLWLSIVIKDKCPYCGEEIEIKPDMIGYRLGTRMKNKDGEYEVVDEGSNFAVCPCCDKHIDLSLCVELKKRKGE